MAVEQTSIELIFEKQNELNIDDFNLWLISNYEELKAQHKIEVMGAFDCGQEDAYKSGFSTHGSSVFYKETYG
jgi:predicted aldo/keto reductase-like oxidoreductase